ncbi:MAG: cell wall hydrolase [Clostridiales bacterium]|nr:cell wall hydrolase [Clostridiales bacterium]
MRKLKLIRRCYKRLRKRYKKVLRRVRPQVKLAAIVLALIFSIAGVGSVVGRNNNRDVYAAEVQEQMIQPQSTIPPGINGALTGVRKSQEHKSHVERIGTSCEDVIVGQRAKEVKVIRMMDASYGLKQAVSDISDQAAVSCSSTIMSDTDYDTLLHIVEAEAGGEDLEGRIMVANVILNRVESEEFPDSVYDVVWEVSNGMPQFSPTVDGRIHTVTVSDTTVKAVQSAIEGKDLSKGALFFVAKDQANKEYVKWFDEDLKYLFRHGVHTFYTYPDKA